MNTTRKWQFKQYTDKKPSIIMIQDYALHYTYIECHLHEHRRMILIFREIFISYSMRNIDIIPYAMNTLLNASITQAFLRNLIKIHFLAQTSMSDHFRFHCAIIDDWYFYVYAGIRNYYTKHVWIWSDEGSKKWNAHILKLSVVVKWTVLLFTDITNLPFMIKLS